MYWAATEAGGTGLTDAPYMRSPLDPRQPLQGVNGYGCKAGACLLYSGFFNVTVTQSNPSGRALPGGRLSSQPARAASV